MLKRVFVLLVLIAATVSAGPPVQASTPIGVSEQCYQASLQWPWFATYRCLAYVSGGTGSYVSYTWKFSSSHGNMTLVSSEPEIDFTCSRDQTFQLDVYVTDSAGATGSVMGNSYRCNVDNYEPL